MADVLAPLIEDRAGWITSPGLQPVRRGLELILRYRECVALAGDLAKRPSAAVMDDMAARIARKVSIRGLGHVPTHGPALIVANHPTGIADGLVMWHVLSKVRRDMFFYANRDILTVLPQVAEHIIPVEWRLDRRTHTRTKLTLEGTKQAFDAQRLGVIFPSGRLAKRRGLSLQERPWMHSAAMIARKFDLPVIPVHIKARNSALFYAFDAIHPTLRDITLFHETLNKDRQRFDVTLGAPIAARSLPVDPADSIDVLRRATLALRDVRKPSWETMTTGLQLGAG